MHQNNNANYDDKPMDNNNNAKNGKVSKDKKKGAHKHDQSSTANKNTKDNNLNDQVTSHSSKQISEAPVSADQRSPPRERSSLKDKSQDLESQLVESEKARRESAHLIR